MKAEKNNKISDVIDVALKNLKNMADVNTDIGSPIETKENELIIPISKVTVGVLAGGGEYGKINVFKSEDDLPFSAGNGAIISVKPCAFLIKTKNDYKILNVGCSNLDGIFDKITNCIGELSKNETK